MVDQKLNLLNPSDETIREYRDIETTSIQTLKKMLKDAQVDKELAKVALQSTQLVNKLRTNLRAEISIKTRIFKDISEDKNELKMYIEATFPKMIK